MDKTDFKIIAMICFIGFFLGLYSDNVGQFIVGILGLLLVYIIGMNCFIIVSVIKDYMKG